MSNDELHDLHSMSTRNFSDASNHENQSRRKIREVSRSASDFLRKLSSWSDRDDPMLLWKALDTLELSELPDALAALESASLNPNLRLSLMKAAVAKCSNQGEIGSVLEIIEGGNYEGDLLRELTLAAFSGSSSSMDELFYAVGTFTESKARESALAGLRFRLIRDKFVDLKFLDFSKTPADVARIAIDAVGTNLASLSSFDQRRIFKEVVEVGMAIDASNRDEVSVLDVFLWKSAKSVPFDVSWEIYHNNIDVSTEMRKMIAVEMVKVDPQKAIEAVIERNDNTEDLSLIINAWRSGDPEAFAMWASADPVAQTGIIRDLLLTHKASTAGIADSWDLVSQIEDPVLKKTIEGKVWSRERNLLHRAVEENPEGALMDIVAGKSSFKDYWLEEAMTVWMDSDSQRASDWYQNIRNSIPPSKSQYISASFAKIAASQGDMSSAREWANSIYDAKTRKRIEAEIEKAGAAAN
ncbi:hypothetical protein [Luteolibacter marinus]|uniref:hypothetical protein n=1 Tax=Luteolibacter marinus TaxID=2776705 RepID=UPI00186909BD|nr:hypothetical protein [Luteolibacter marinus]